MLKLKRRVSALVAGSLTVLVTMFIFFSRYSRDFSSISEFLGSDAYRMLLPVLACLSMAVIVMSVIAYNSYKELKVLKAKEADEAKRKAEEASKAVKDAFKAKTKLLLECETAMNFTVMRDYSMFSNRRSKNYWVAQYILFSAVGLLGVSGVILNFAFSQPTFLMMPVVSFVVALLLGGDMLNSYTRIKKIAGGFHYYFYDDVVNVNYKNSSVDVDTQHPYGDFYAAYESKKGFYMYTLASGGYVISKKFLSDGQQGSLREVFKEKYGDLFTDFCS